MSSITRPASFIPPEGKSRPYWLKVTLPKREEAKPRKISVAVK